jgi:small conductance mechanosensitive channel
MTEIFTVENIKKILFDWILANGIKIVVIIIVAAIFQKIFNLFLKKIIHRAVVRQKGMITQAEEKRENTLIRVFGGALGIGIWITAITIILSEIGINIGPLIAAAGIAGIALGFGGQYLIRDIISGLFIILENQYRVGDVVKLGDVSGMVEDITLRMTLLRDLDGNAHHIPNGEIKVASNLSKEFSKINLDIGISYSSDIEKVIAVINEVGQKLALDPAWQEKIIEPPTFLRVDDFADSAIVIKITGKTTPLDKWAVAGEFRKRLKIAFDESNIEIPFPQRVIHQAK